MTTDTELDRIYEAAIADEWEELTKPPEKPEGWQDACKKIVSAVDLLREAVETLKEAAEMVEGTVKVDRIRCLESETYYLAADVEKQAERMKA